MEVVALEADGARVEVQGEIFGDKVQGQVGLRDKQRWRPLPRGVWAPKR